MIRVIVSCLGFLALYSKPGNPVAYRLSKTIIYTESDSDFANPERGFYRPLETHAGRYVPLNAAQLKAWRGLQQADRGNYKIYSTLVFRSIVLDSFTNSPLSSDLLGKIRADFRIAREAGIKLIPRFSYISRTHAGSCPESPICPPYGDAPKHIVLQHIAQLKPILQENADVIACMQLGFIGIWGENYYSDYFGDASTNAQGRLYDSNWTDRFTVLKALLQALPADRMVMVRIPQLKQRYVYGIQAPVSAAPLTDAEAFSGTDKARIGMHNDCFLSGPDDYSTYDDYGNSSLPRKHALEALKAYAEADNKYVAVGGETCDDAFSPQNDCETTGMAQTEMRRLHYSFLNSAYNNDVNNDWETGGCMDSIKKNLGYRFVLKSGVFPASPVKAGTSFSFVLDIENAGYASPFNERPARLVMRSQNGKIFSFDLKADVRKWYSGMNRVQETIVTGASMPKGKYDLFLYLPDKYSSIASRPEYAIRLANRSVWEDQTGYNRLLESITID